MRFAVDFPACQVMPSAELAYLEKVHEIDLYAIRRRLGFCHGIAAAEVTDEQLLTAAYHYASVCAADVRAAIISPGMMQAIAALADYYCTAGVRFEIIEYETVIQIETAPLSAVSIYKKTLNGEHSV